MSSKILLSFLGGCLALFLVMGISTYNSVAQVVPYGQTDKPATQLIVPVLEDDTAVIGNTSDTINRHTHVQVTNTSTDGVVVHVQFLKADEDCAEIDFFDTFTGEDTHVYTFDDSADSVREAGGGFPFNIDGRNGILVITPVLSADDPTALAFNHLHGVAHIFNSANVTEPDEDDIYNAYRFNAVGRRAVDLTTGALLADDTELDGTVNGLERIVPDEVMYHYTSDFGAGSPVFADLMFVAIADDYGIDYKAVSGKSALFSLENICDNDEICISCGDEDVSCLEIFGINNEITNIDSSVDVVCDETSHDEGWDRFLARSGETADATFGIIGLMTSDVAGAAHMFVE